MPHSSSCRAIDKEIGERIQRRRRALGLEVHELAQLAKISPETLKGIEEGLGQLAGETLFLLAKALGIPAAQLF